MGVRLTSRQLRRLTDVIRDISSPLASEDVDEWRLRVTSSFKALLQADKAVFAVAGLSTPAFFSAELGGRTMNDYASHYFESDPGVARMREISGSVYSRSLLWGSLPGVFEKTEVFNDWYVPLGLTDGCGIRLYENLPGTDVVKSSERQPSVILGAYKDRKGTEPFGTWGTSVMQMLAPAIEAAVIARRALGQFQKDITTVIDALPSAIVAYDLYGGMLHRNRALQTLLENEPGRDATMGATRELALQLIKQVTPAAREIPSQPKPLTQILRPHQRSYSIHATYLPGGFFGSHPAIAVIVKRTERSPHSQLTGWADRFSLTRRELQVVTLLLNRYSNDEIAHALGVSPHTVRHHIENVYQKTGVSGRNALHALLGGG